MFEKARNPIALTLAIAALGGVAARGSSAAENKASQEAIAAPGTVLKSYDNRLAVLESRIAGSHGVQKLPSKSSPLLSQSLEIVLPGCDLYAISEPSPTQPGRFNALSVVVNQRSKKAIWAAINNGINSSKITNKFLENDSGTGMMLEHADGNFKYTPNSITVSVGKVANKPWIDYHVGTGKLGGEAIEYSNNPSAVTRQFNTFFVQAEKIIGSN